MVAFGRETLLARERAFALGHTCPSCLHKESADQRTHDYRGLCHLCATDRRFKGWEPQQRSEEHCNDGNLTERGKEIKAILEGMCGW